MDDEPKQPEPNQPVFAHPQQAAPLNKMIGKMLPKSALKGKSNIRPSSVHITHKGRPRSGKEKRPGFY
jgi:hypothetical protein